MPVETLTDLIVNYGWTTALVIFFVWQSAKREERVSTRLNEVESYCRGELAEINKQYHLLCSQTIEVERQSNELRARTCDVMERLDKTLRSRWMIDEDSA